eukprot:scaffold313924_cov30-Tisochrysis_lutea.AAC.1
MAWSATSGALHTPRLGTTVVKAYVRDAHKANIGQQLELEFEPALCSRLALLGQPWGVVARGLEGRITAPAPPTACHAQRLAVVDHLSDERIVSVGAYDCAGRHAHVRISARLAMPRLAHTVLSARRAEVDLLFQHIQPLIAHEVDGAAPSAIASGRPHLGLILLPPEGDAAVAAVARLDPDARAVKEEPVFFVVCLIGQTRSVT